MTGPRPGDLGWSSLGHTQRVEGDRVAAASARFEAELTYAEKAQTHVWAVVVAHRVTDALARAIATDPSTEPMLDAETVAYMGVGCFRCEEPLTPRLLDRRCKGEPRH